MTKYILALLLTFCVAAGFAVSSASTADAKTKPVRAHVAKINLSVAILSAYATAAATCKHIASKQGHIRYTPLGRCRPKTVWVSGCYRRRIRRNQARCYGHFEVDVSPRGYWLDCVQSTWWRRFGPIVLKVKEPYTACNQVPSGVGSPT
jgi:hypothetical protein